MIIIMAALLLEILSGAQYFFTRRLMGEELEKRAEGELTLKTVLVKSTLNASEDLLKSFMWKIQAHLDIPDSAYVTMSRIARIGAHVQGCGVAFVPDYYPQKGKLYEVYARREADGKVEVEQIGGPDHDYTQSRTYQQILASQEAVWIEPYEDKEGAKTTIITYAMPLFEGRRNTDGSLDWNSKRPLAGLAAVDVSLEWLSDTINSHHTYPSSFALLLTEGGKPIIQLSDDQGGKETSAYIIGLINDSTVARHQSTSGQSTMIHFDTDERDGTIFYASMEGNPHWQVAVVCYDDEVYASLAKLRLWMLLLMLLAFGILLHVIWRYARGEKKLQVKTLEQERINGELRIASDIQQALLPTMDDGRWKKEDGISVEGRLIPAKAVGGDLYNAFVRDGKLFFCIGDVSGKGIPAALIMAIIQALFRNIAERENNPAHIMSQINETACRNNKSNFFVTLFIGVLDLPTGRLRYCNAGHEVPLLVDQTTKQLSAKPNLPIGLFADFTYEMQETVMEAGSTLFLYTDGLTEARDAQHRLYGKERVMKMIADCKTTDTKTLVDAVVAEVKLFSENTEQSDDLTLLAVNYTPAKEQYVLDETLTLKNDVKEVTTLNAFVKDVTARLGIEKSLASRLQLALEEAVVNVMEYAYPPRTTGEISIRVMCSAAHHQKLTAVIADSGVAFNPTEAAVADTTLSAEERPIGGLGILLVRELMDSINYERIDGKNVLTLTKMITS